MATDPYHTFAADLRASLDTARQLSRRYKSLQTQKRELQSSSSGSPPSYGYTTSASSSGTSSSSLSSLAAVESQIQSTYTELQDHLETLENDVNDVQESVDMLEKRGPELFGVDSTELRKRKSFVESCSEEITVSVSHKVPCERAGVEGLVKIKMLRVESLTETGKDGAGRDKAESPRLPFNRHAPERRPRRVSRRGR
jgi:Tfp pilus assembly protein PilW